MGMTTQCTCGGEIGPDLTGRPMCYVCGPREMAPVDNQQPVSFTYGGVPPAVRFIALDAQKDSGCTCHGMTFYSPACHPACPAAKAAP